MKNFLHFLWLIKSIFQDKKLAYRTTTILSLLRENKDSIKMQYFNKSSELFLLLFKNMDIEVQKKYSNEINNLVYQEKINGKSIMDIINENYFIIQFLDIALREEVYKQMTKSVNHVSIKNLFIKIGAEKLKKDINLLPPTVKYSRFFIENLLSPRFSIKKLYINQKVEDSFLARKINYYLISNLPRKIIFKNFRCLKLDLNKISNKDQQILNYYLKNTHFYCDQYKEKYFFNFSLLDINNLLYNIRLKNKVVLYLLYKNQHLIGYFILQTYLDNEDVCLNLKTIYIDPLYQNFKIGKELLEYLLKTYDINMSVHCRNKKMLHIMRGLESQYLIKGLNTPESFDYIKLKNYD